MTDQNQTNCDHETLVILLLLNNIKELQMQMWRFDCNQIKQPCNVHQMNIFTYKEHMQLQILLSNEQSRTLEGFNNNKKIIKMENQRILNIFLKY